jgi:hypothetical protein
MFTVTNNSMFPVSPVSVVIEGKDATDFLIEGGCPVTLNSMAGCMISVGFYPATPGRKEANLAVSIGDTKTVASLRGFGVEKANITLTPMTQPFGTVPIGQKSAATFIVENTGGTATGALSTSIIGLNISDFTVHQQHLRQQHRRGGQLRESR